MSLGDNTKCDLSAGIAKIDIEKLTKQIELHFYSIVNKIRKKADIIQYANIQDRRVNVASMSSTGAKDFIQLSKNLAETTELLHTLYESSERTIEIV